MDNPRTIYEILQMLEEYHDQRRATYDQLCKQTSDSQAQILLEHLVELEDHSQKAVVRVS